MGVFREKLQNSLIGTPNILLIPRERHPPEWSLALAEQWADVSRNETGELEGIFKTPLTSFVSYRVSIVKHLGTLGHKANHCRHMLCHRLFGTLRKLSGVALGIIAGILKLDTLRDVVEGVVSTGLVGHDINWHISSKQFVKHRCRISNHTNRERLLLCFVAQHPLNRIIKIVGNLI